MEKKTLNQKIIEDDILRYKRNKFASMFALLGLAFNCLYFCILYAMPSTAFFKIEIGISVVLTLILLLTIFLSSEGVKGYNKKFSIVLVVCAAFQILRIFYYPLKGLNDEILTGIGYFGYYPTSSHFYFVMMLLWLVLSAACLVISAVFGWIYAVRLESFQKKLNSGEIVIEETLKALDKEDEQAASAVAEKEVAPEEVK